LTGSVGGDGGGDAVGDGDAVGVGGDAVGVSQPEVGEDAGPGPAVDDGTGL
jgi:hypothetical protein